ncbi:MAG TPA: PAS-domain containing protein [Azospirillaceae bacterium]|nr:PAS-domain containing protein [Azospirillaceae bacterium]
MVLQADAKDRRALKVTLPSLFLMVAGVAVVIGILTAAGWRQDGYERDETIELVENLLARESRMLERVAAEAGWSTEAFDKLAANLDAGWAESRLGGALASHFNITSAYVLDARNHPAFTWEGGWRGPDDDPMASYSGGIRELVERARRQTPPGTETHPAPTPAPVSGFLRRGADVVMAAAAEVTAGPEYQGPRADGTVLLLVRRLDGGMLDEFGEGFGLDRLRLVAAGEGGLAASWPITGADGASLAQLAWEPPHRGRQLFQDALVPVSGALMVMLALGLMAIVRSNSTAAALAQSGRRLTESEARFRVFAETASDWLWESDRDHTYTFVSDRLGEALGGRSDAVLGHTLKRLAHSQGDGEAGRTLHEALAVHQPFRNVAVELELENGGGHRTLRLSGQPFFDAAGRFQGYRGTGVDITEQVRAFREAERIRDLLYDAVESISEGFVLFGADGRLVVCNERYRAAYPLLADCLVPGVTFTEVLRVAAQRGGYREAMNDLASWVAERLARHMQAGASTDHCLADGCWYRISERATRSGGVVKILTDITELKRHEEALANKTRLLQATFDNIAQGIVVADGEGRLLAWNGNFPRVLAYPRDLVQTGERLACLRELDRERGVVVTETFGDTTATLSAGGGESGSRRRVSEIVLPDGRVVEARESPMPDGGVVATYTDITERKRFERVLAELSQTVSRTKGNLFFHQLIASLVRALKVEVAFIGVFDEQGVVETVAVSEDGRVAHNFEYHADAAPGGDPRDHDIHFVTDRLDERLSPESALARWGAQTYLGKTLVDSANNPVGVIAVLARQPLEQPATARTLLDIFAVRAAAELERLQNETAIQESEYRYRQLVELAPYGIVIWDGNHILFTNEAAARIFGAPSAAAIIGTDLGERFRSLNEDSVLQRLVNPLATPWDGKPMEVRVLDDAGEVVDVEVSVFLFAHEGRAASLVMFNDITHRKRAEQALQHAHKMQAVGELAGGVAHEFNNMLTAIGGFAHMAKRNTADTKRVDFCITEIIKASDRAAGLTAQLLSFSRRGLQENIQRFAVSKLMDDLEGFLRPVMGERVEVAFDVRVPGIHLNADPSLLHQALVNLAINGRDAMPDGGTITIIADLVKPTPAMRDRHPDLRGARYVAISVRDTGSGIEPAVLDRIFEPFFTTKEQGKGTGLGLPLVYSTITRAGGAVEVTSEIGRGSTFILYLPAEAGTVSGEAEAPHEALDHHLHATVLLVEDEDQVRDFIRLTLGDQGLKVVTAVDGVDAVEVFRAHDGAFDLVITDLVMPRAGGVEVARVMEREAPAVPILFMSGYAPGPQADGLTLAEGRRRAFLGKPIDSPKLVAAVRDLLIG